MTTAHPAVWVDERLVVERSRVEGRGLFFSAGVAEGTVVIELGGRLVSTELERLIADADAGPQALGEEATIDYGTQSGAPFRMTCTCGTPACRGVVSSDDWQNDQLQSRYGNHWVPALQARIDGP